MKIRDLRMLCHPYKTGWRKTHAGRTDSAPGFVLMNPLKKGQLREEDHAPPCSSWVVFSVHSLIIEQDDGREKE
jgi:hypothetical protein